MRSAASDRVPRQLGDRQGLPAIDGSAEMRLDRPSRATGQLATSRYSYVEVRAARCGGEAFRLVSDGARTSGRVIREAIGGATRSWSSTKPWVRRAGSIAEAFRLRAGDADPARVDPGARSGRDRCSSPGTRVSDSAARAAGLATLPARGLSARRRHPLPDRGGTPAVPGRADRHRGTDRRAGRRPPGRSAWSGARSPRSRSLGKNLLIRFDNGLEIRTHLRMNGSWHRYRPGERWRRPPWRARLVLEVPGAVAVCFDAPVVELLEQRAEALHPSLGRLGPDMPGARLRCRRGDAPAPRPGRVEPLDRRGAARPASAGRDRQHLQERDPVDRAGLAVRARSPISTTPRSERPDRDGAKADARQRPARPRSRRESRRPAIELPRGAVYVYGRARTAVSADAGRRSAAIRQGSRPSPHDVLVPGLPGARRGFGRAGRPPRRRVASVSMCEHFIARAADPFRLDELWPFTARLEQFGIAGFGWGAVVAGRRRRHPRLPRRPVLSRRPRPVHGREGRDDRRPRPSAPAVEALDPDAPRYAALSRSGRAVRVQPQRRPRRLPLAPRDISCRRAGSMDEPIRRSAPAGSRTRGVTRSPRRPCSAGFMTGSVARPTSLF